MTIITVEAENNAWIPDLSERLKRYFPEAKLIERLDEIPEDPWEWVEAERLRNREAKQWEEEGVPVIVEGDVLAPFMKAWMHYFRNPWPELYELDDYYRKRLQDFRLHLSQRYVFIQQEEKKKWRWPKRKSPLEEEKEAKYRYYNGMKSHTPELIDLVAYDWLGTYPEYLEQHWPAEHPKREWPMHLYEFMIYFAANQRA
ncbi:hypothetical protein SAMN05421781_0048 [Marinococcus luteus]|uniref:Uncharacterized protein n=1 Tax=Marinococcus luteus TaxID=1122204 RepID=A0A1H2PZA1_9BACI|nr:hypothetical protein [Marinococcus luteus]SDW00192.1 hypothetical protein SAMN05421781_0048 [Marinococcus luteus]